MIPQPSSRQKALVGDFQSTPLLSPPLELRRTPRSRAKQVDTWLHIGFEMAQHIHYLFLMMFNDILRSTPGFGISSQDLNHLKQVSSSRIIIISANTAKDRSNSPGNRSHYILVCGGQFFILFGAEKGFFLRRVKTFNNYIPGF